MLDTNKAQQQIYPVPVSKTYVSSFCLLSLITHYIINVPISVESLFKNNFNKIIYTELQHNHYNIYASSKSLQVCEILLFFKNSLKKFFFPFKEIISSINVAGKFQAVASLIVKQSSSTIPSFRLFIVKLSRL